MIVRCLNMIILLKIEFASPFFGREDYSMIDSL
jgi:hypothetical protein